MLEPLTLFPRTVRDRDLCSLIHDGRRYVVYAMQRACVIYTFKTDYTFAFVQLLKPSKCSRSHGNIAIRYVAVHEELGVIAVAVKNEVILYAPLLQKYEAASGEGSTKAYKSVWTQFASLTVDDDITAISLMPIVKKIEASKDTEESRHMFLAVANSELTIWDCKLAQEFALGCVREDDIIKGSYFKFSKRWSTKVSCNIKSLKFSRDGVFLAQLENCSKIVKVWYEVRTEYGFPEEERSSHDLRSDEFKGVRYDFTYLIHPEFVSNFSWNPPDNTGRTGNISVEKATQNMLLTNCYDGVARLWSETPVRCVYKFSLATSIQTSSPDEMDDISQNIYTNNMDVRELSRIQKRSSKRSCSMLGWMCMSLSVMRLGKGDLRHFNKDEKSLANSPSECSKKKHRSYKDYDLYKSRTFNDQNKTIGNSAKCPYNFSSLKNNKIDTENGILFQVKRDGTIGFWKLEGVNDTSSTYYNMSYGIGTVPLTNSFADISRTHVDASDALCVQGKSMRAKVIMTVSTPSPPEFVSFFSSECAFVHLFVDLEPVIISYDNIIIPERALLIGISKQGYIRPFSVFIEAYEKSLWIVPRISVLDYFSAPCESIKDIWFHSNADMPLNVIHGYNDEFSSTKDVLVDKLCIYYGAMCNSSLLVSTIDISYPAREVVENSLKCDLKLTWIQTGPILILWGIDFLNPLVYLLSLPKLPNVKNPSLSTHRLCGKASETLSYAESPGREYTSIERIHERIKFSPCRTVEKNAIFIGSVVLNDYYRDYLEKSENQNYSNQYTKPPRLLLLDSFDSARHDTGSKIDNVLNIKSGLIVVFDTGLYVLWNLSLNENREMTYDRLAEGYIYNLGPDETISRVDVIFSPCELFQLHFAMGYHLFSAIVKSKEKDAVIFCKYGTKEICTPRCSDEILYFMKKVRMNQDIIIFKGNLLGDSCVVGKLEDGTYCLSIWEIFEHFGFSIKLTYKEIFEEEIVDVDWLVLPSTQVIIAVAQKHKIHIYTKQIRDIDCQDPLWARLKPFTIDTIENITDVKWIKSDCYMLAVITNEIVFFLEDWVDTWNLPADKELFPAALERINLSLFDEIDILGEQSYNCNPKILLRYMLIGDFDYVKYIFSILFFVIKTYPQNLEEFMKICFIWMYRRNESVSQRTNSKETFDSLNTLSDGELDDGIVRDIEEIIKNIRTDFGRKEMEYIKNYFAKKEIKKIGAVDVSHLVYCMEILIDTESLRQEFGINSLRYAIFYLMNKKLKNRAMKVSEVIWAFFSSSRNNLLKWVKSMNDDRLDWQTARKAGIGWWAGDREMAIDIMKHIAGIEYVPNGQTAKHSPEKCMLFYSALKKKGVLIHMWRLARDHPESKIMEFLLSLDTSDPNNRSILDKNAYGLISRRRFLDAAALFLINGKLKEAVNVCIKKLNDTELALLVCRVYDAEGNVTKQIIRDTLLPMAIEECDRWKACMLFYIIEEYDKAVLSTMVPLNDLLDPKTKIDSNGQSKPESILIDGQPADNYTDPLIYTLYKGLIMHRPSTWQRTRSQIASYYPGFILRCSSEYEKMGMYDLAFTLARKITFEDYDKGLMEKVSEYNTYADENLNIESWDKELVNRAESHLFETRFWDILNANVANGEEIFNTPSLAKLTLWRMLLRLLKILCVSIDIVSQRCVYRNIPSVFTEYSQLSLTHLNKIILMVKIPYSLVNRTVVSLCRDLNMSGIYSIMQFFIESRKKQGFGDDSLQISASDTNVELLSEFASLVSASSYRQICLLKNSRDIDCWGDICHLKSMGVKSIGLNKLKHSVTKAAELSRQILVSIIMYLEAFFGEEDKEEDSHIRHYNSDNETAEDSLFNYLTLVVVMFSNIFTSIEELLVEESDVIITMVKELPNIIELIYQIFYLKSSKCEEDTITIFRRAAQILNQMYLMKKEAANSRENESKDTSDQEDAYSERIDENDFYDVNTILFSKEELQQISLKFVKVVILSYFMTEIDVFMGNIVTERENPLNNDCYWFVLELIFQPLNKILCNLQFEYAYFYATKGIIRLESIHKFLPTKQFRDIWDYLNKVENIPLIYAAVLNICEDFDFVRETKSKSDNHLNYQDEYSSENITGEMGKELWQDYVSCGHKLIRLQEEPIEAFTVSQTNCDTIVTYNGNDIDEISMSEVSCVVRKKQNSPALGTFKRFVKGLDLTRANYSNMSSRHVDAPKSPDVRMLQYAFSKSNKIISDGLETMGSLDRFFGSRSNTSIDNRQSTYNRQHNKGMKITSLDSHPSMNYYIGCVTGLQGVPNRTSHKEDSHLHSLGSTKTDLSTMPYVQLNHFGDKKPIMKYPGNYTKLLRCKFDSSGSSFGVIGSSGEVSIWRFDSHVQSMNSLMKFETRILLPLDLTFIQSSTVLAVGGSCAPDYMNLALCDILLPKNKNIIREYATSNECITSLIYCPNSRLIFAAGKKKDILVFDLRSDAPLATLPVTKGTYITSLCLEDKLGYVLAGTSQGTIDIWDISTLKLKDTWRMRSPLNNYEKYHKRTTISTNKEVQLSPIVGIMKLGKTGDIITCSNSGNIWKSYIY